MPSDECRACKYYTNCVEIGHGNPYHSDCPRDMAIKAEWKRLDDIEYNKLKGFTKFVYWFLRYRG
jgi:hypothetical protein